MTQEAEKIEYYRRQIKEISEKYAQGKSVTLLAATKTVSAERINIAVKESGLRDIGENRVQELLEKYDAIDKENLNIHFIGTLQTNKVKYIIDKVCMIQSVDSINLAKEINRQAEKHGIIMDILIEINIGQEENKSGIMPGEIKCFLDSLAQFKNIRPKGIMTIAPRCDCYEQRLDYFKKTYEIYSDIVNTKPHGIEMSVLSMGMTDSYAEAIMCGANMVRIGSGIFGLRTPASK